MAGLVHQFLETSAGVYPDKTALLDGELEATYSEIDSLANRLARLLTLHGLQKGDRVLMIMENSLKSVVGYYGVLKAGGVCVEVPERTTGAEASYYIQNSGAKICILSSSSAKRLSDIDVPCVIGPDVDLINRSITRLTWSDVKAMPDRAPENRVTECDLAAIVYTSGSTGRPKGVMLTHKNLCTNTASIVSYLNLTEADRVMAVLPFYYVYGKTLLNTHFMVGGSVVVNNRFAFPNSVVKDMSDKEVTGFAGVPSTFAILLNRIGVSENTHSEPEVYHPGGRSHGARTDQASLDCIGSTSSISCTAPPRLQPGSPTCRRRGFSVTSSVPSGSRSRRSRSPSATRAEGFWARMRWGTSAQRAIIL